MTVVAPDVDIRDSAGVRVMIQNATPDVVINVAAKTNIDWCEQNKLTAFDINTQGAANIGAACAEVRGNARALGARSIFTERENDAMTLRRGFSIARGERGIVAEDVVTTGGSIAEVIKLIETLGGKTAGVVSLVDRLMHRAHMLDFEGKSYRLREAAARIAASAPADS